MKKFILLFLFYSSFTYSQEKPIGEDAWTDLKTTFNYLFKGGLAQFKQKQNLAHMAVGVPALWYSFEEDDRLSALLRSKKSNKVLDISGDLGVVLNFPIVPLTAYYLGRKNNDKKLVHFAMEYSASLYLALAESGLISFIHVHERPDTSNTSVWEEAFRGDSSWPSGHVVPAATLTFKTLQYYGPWWALIPGALTILTSYQRVQDGKHYMSDVVGGILLSALASEGVRAVANNKENNSFYNWLYRHDAMVGLLRYKNAIGPRFSFNY